MIEWKRLYMKPAGSLPGGVVTQWGVGAITVFILLFLTYWIWLGGGEPTEVAGLTEVATTAPRSFSQQMTARVDAETMRAKTKEAAQARALKQQQQQQANVAGLTAAHQAAVLAGPSPDTGQPYTEEEWQLRERLRLEAVERRSRSLRSAPVAQSYRKIDGGGSGRGAERIVTDPIATAKAEGAAALQTALDTFGTVTSGLENQIKAEAQSDQDFIAALRGMPTTPELAPASTATTAASVTAQDYSIAARASAGYLAVREDSDKRLVLDHATSEVAKDLIIAAKDAVESYKGLQDNTNVSNTALAQSQIAGAVTQGHLTASMVQLMAFQAAKESAEGYEREITRREALAERVIRQQQADLMYNAHLDGIASRTQSMREGMLVTVPALYNDQQ